MTPDQIAKMQAGRVAKQTERVKQPSKARAIREKCRDCIYDEHDAGTWLQQVTACDSKDCALWPVRPVSKAIVLPNLGSGAIEGKNSAETD